MRKFVGMTIFVAVLLSLIAGCAFAQAAQSVELHGYMQNRLYTNPSMSTHFVTERVSLSAVGKINDSTTGYLEVYFHPWITDQVVANGLTTVPVTPTSNPTNALVTGEQSRVYLESAYLDRPLGPGRIRIGKGRQLNFGLTPSYPNRKTTQYGILAETFTQDRIMGFQWSAKGKDIDGGVSFFQDQDLGTRNIGDNAGAILNTDSQGHVCDRDNTANNSGRMAVSGRIGVTKPTFQFHVSGCLGRLNPNQLVAVNSLGYGWNRPANTNTDHSKFGVDSIWSKGPLVVQGEWYTGKFSFLGITGYQVLVGWQPKDKPRYVLRWSALNNNQTPTGKPRTWNAQQFTAGYVYPIAKGVWMEINYERNMTSNPRGTTAPKDDMLFTEFFTGF